MSISTKLTKLETDISNAYTSIATKGGTIPQNKNTDNLPTAIASISGGGSEANIFIQDTQPEGYDGIWVADSAYENYPIVEIDSKNNRVASSINIMKGNNYKTTLFNSNIDWDYSFRCIFITNANNEILEKNIYYGNGSEWVLIPRYIKLSYIESYGYIANQTYYGQYINTGIVGKSGLSCEATFMAVSLTGDQCMLGSRSGNNRFYMLYNYPQGRFNIGYGGNNNIAPMATNTIYEYYCSLKQGEQKVIINGDTVYNGTSTSSFNTGKNLTIFALNYNSVYLHSSIRLYALKLYDNDVPVRDYIPVKDLDNVVCLYDKVSNQFFYNQGSGSFTAGNEV